MAYTKDELLALVREAGSEMTLRQKLRLTVLLSIPAIIAHISIIAMQMIDAAMLGHLSTEKASAVGGGTPHRCRRQQRRTKRDKARSILWTDICLVTRSDRYHYCSSPTPLAWRTRGYLPRCHPILHPLLIRTAIRDNQQCRSRMSDMFWQYQSS